MDLRDAVVVLTGASRGLGVFIAEDLARAGAHLVLSARSAGDLEATAAKVREAGGQATVVPGDVSKPEDREALAAAAEALGPVRALINNAGIEIAKAVADQSPSDIERQIAVNLTAPILLARRLLPGMIAAGQGAIVTISSMSGKSATPWNGIYAATKHGINGFTSSLRVELAGTGVHASVVCPSFVADAGMWSDTGVKAPTMLREVTPQAVVAGVRKALAGAPEVLVTPGPIRPLLALAQVFPGVDGWVMGKMGILDALKARAEVVKGKG